MDAFTLDRIRSDANGTEREPIPVWLLPLKSSGTCVGPEFPATITVRFPQVVDGQFVIELSGATIDGARLTYDTIKQRILYGSLTLQENADRSDYAALSAQQVQAQVLRGGAWGIDTSSTISSYETSLVRTLDSKTNTTYLVPALVAKGALEGTTDPVSIVVPLIAQ